MFEELSKLGIQLDSEKVELLKSFSEFLIEYNQKINLISRKETNLLFEKHIYDSLAINLFLQKYKIQSSSKILDIGTGGGFPSLPCSIIFDNLSFLCIDSVSKKINFIKECAQKLGIKNIFPQCVRAEDLDTGYRNSFYVVVSRAMAELRIILEYAIPYVKVNGFFVAYKSIKAEEEILNAQNSLKLLNAKAVEIIEYSLPIEDNNKRVLLIIKKEKETDFRFPRKNGLISKKPL